MLSIIINYIVKIAISNSSILVTDHQAKVTMGLTKTSNGLTTDSSSNLSSENIIINKLS